MFGVAFKTRCLFRCRQIDRSGGETARCDESSRPLPRQCLLFAVLTPCNHTDNTLKSTLQSVLRNMVYFRLFTASQGCRAKFVAESPQQIYLKRTKSFLRLPKPFITSWFENLQPLIWSEDGLSTNSACQRSLSHDFCPYSQVFYSLVSLKL